MSFYSIKKFFSFAVIVFLFSSCQGKLELPQITLNPDGSSATTISGLICKAAISDGSTTIEPNQTVKVVIEIGGILAGLFIPPYTVQGIEQKFQDAKITVDQVFENNSTIIQSITKKYRVTANDGNGIDCPLTVSINPVPQPTTIPGTPIPVGSPVATATPTPVPLNCAISTDPQSPLIKEKFIVRVDVAGGTTPYTLTKATFGDSSIMIDSSLAAYTGDWNTGHGSASVYGTTVGAQNFSAAFKDGAGNVVTCSKSVTIRDVPKLTVSSSPSSSTPVNSSILLTAIPSGFSCNPVITHFCSACTPGVKLVQNGNTAVVTSLDGKAQTFQIKVEAMCGTEKAVLSVPLEFTPVPAVSCTISHSPTSNVLINQNVTFQVSATNGQPVYVTSFNGTPVNPTSSSYTTQFSTSGYKTVYIQAQTASGIPCNKGSVLNYSLIVKRPLACSVKLSSYYGNSSQVNKVLATAVLPYDANVQGSVWAVSASASPNAPAAWDPCSYLSAYFQFQNPGTYQVYMKVRDSSGNEGVCTPAVYQVYPSAYYGACY